MMTEPDIEEEDEETEVKPEVKLEFPTPQMTYLGKCHWIYKVIVILTLVATLPLLMTSLLIITPLILTFRGA